MWEASGSCSAFIAASSDSTSRIALVISGVGTTNNSGGTQNFITNGETTETVIFFTHSATAGSNTTFQNIGGPSGSLGETIFFGNASAGNATFINHANGRTEFRDNSTAANGTFINEGGVTILDSLTTAANGTFINNAGVTVLDGTGANAVFTNNSASAAGAFGGRTNIIGTAGSATITNNGGSIAGAGGGSTIFLGGTGGNATITNNGGTVSGALGGYTQFTFDSTADSATLIANSGTSGGGGGTIFFEANSAGSTSRVELFGNGSLDIS
jgi:hypothetical protein